MREVLCNSYGDKVPFNEQCNTFGIEVLERVVTKMREDKTSKSSAGARSTRVSQLSCFQAVIREVHSELADKMNSDKDSLTDRQVKMYWAMFKGFNSESSITVNETLAKIAEHFGKFRTGKVQTANDEYGAAIASIKKYYLEVIPDNKRVEGEAWTLIGVNLLNGHLVQLGQEPILFSQDFDENLRMEQARGAFDKMIRRETSSKEDRNYFKIERRPTVHAQRKSLYHKDDSDTSNLTSVASTPNSIKTAPSTPKTPQQMTINVDSNGSSGDQKQPSKRMKLNYHDDF